MTKKHYEAIANIIVSQYDNANINDYGRYRIACELADYFASDNPRFDRARFLEACGVECDGRHDTVNDIVQCRDCSRVLDSM